MEISAIHKDSFTRFDFEEIVSIFCSEDTENVTSKLLRNPLISIDSDVCRFKYDFISDYFKSLNIIHSINSKSHSDDFVKLIAKYSFGDNEVVCSVAKYFNNHQELFYSNSREIILEIKQTISHNQAFAKNDLKFKAIGFLVRLLSALNGTTNSKESFTAKIVDMFGGNKNIENLSIYGDNSPLDFSGLRIKNSRFIGFKHFTKSKFDNVIFTDSYFDTCYCNVTSKGFNKSIFMSCRLGDLESAIDSAEEKSKKNRNLIEKELRRFLNSFFYRGKFTAKKIDSIKISTRIKSINRAFLNHLIKDDVIYVKDDVIHVKEDKADEKYYGITEKYENSVYGFLINNKIDRKIENILSLITQ